MPSKCNDWARVVPMVLVMTLFILEPDYAQETGSTMPNMNASNTSTSAENLTTFTTTVTTTDVFNSTTEALIVSSTSSSAAATTPYKPQTTSSPTEPPAEASTAITKTSTATMEPSTASTESSSLDDETLATIIGIAGGLVIVGLLVLIFFLSIILVKSYKEMVQSQKNRLLAREEEAINEAFKAATCNNHSTDSHEELLHEHHL